MSARHFDSGGSYSSLDPRKLEALGCHASHAVVAVIGDAQCGGAGEALDLCCGP